jgi:Uncharacterised nucleotidyltransferase
MPERLMQFRGARSGPEVDLLLCCARTQISPELSDQIRAAVQTQVNWMALIRLALRHDVMPLLYRSLQRVCPDAVPADILGPLGARYRQEAAQAQCRARELVRILSLFEEQGIPVVPYKGPTLAQRLYGDLALREFGDLDIMILERDIPRAQDLIRRDGYDFVFLKDVSKLADYVRSNRELQFHRSDGARLELHWRFALQLACVKHDPERFLQRFEMIWLAGVQVPSLPLEVYFLILSLHGTKHKWGQLKLICDIAEILRQTDLDWQYVLHEADDLGLKRMLAVGILLAEDPLGAVAPQELAQGLKIDRAARALAAEVRRSLFEEPDENWHAQADYRFQSKIRERLGDRARMFFQSLLPRLNPNQRDRRFLALPESLSCMYYLVRPFRVAWERIAEPKF